MSQEKAFLEQEHAEKDRYCPGGARHRGCRGTNDSLCTLARTRLLRPRLLRRRLGLSRLCVSRLRLRRLWRLLAHGPLVWSVGPDMAPCLGMRLTAQH